MNRIFHDGISDTLVSDQDGCRFHPCIGNTPTTRSYLGVCCRRTSWSWVCLLAAFLRLARYACSLCSEEKESLKRLRNKDWLGLEKDAFGKDAIILSCLRAVVPQVERSNEVEYSGVSFRRRHGGAYICEPGTAPTPLSPALSGLQRSYSRY